MRLAVASKNLQWSFSENGCKSFWWNIKHIFFCFHVSLSNSCTTGIIKKQFPFYLPPYTKSFRSGNKDKWMKLSAVLFLNNELAYFITSSMCIFFFPLCLFIAWMFSRLSSSSFLSFFEVFSCPNSTLRSRNENWIRNYSSEPYAVLFIHVSQRGVPTHSNV